MKSVRLNEKPSPWGLFQVKTSVFGDLGLSPRRTYVRRNFCEAQKIGVKSLVKSVLKSLTTRFVWDKRKKALMCLRVNVLRSPTQFPKSGPHTKCMKRDSAHPALKIGVRMATRPFAKCFTLSPANAILRQIVRVE